jgi:hypothetical protein
MLDLKLDFTAPVQDSFYGEVVPSGPPQEIARGTPAWEAMLDHLDHSHLFVTPCLGPAEAALYVRSLFGLEEMPSSVRVFVFGLCVRDPLGGPVDGVRVAVVMASPKSLNAIRKVAQVRASRGNGSGVDRDEETLASRRYIFCQGVECPEEVLAVFHRMLAAALDELRGI